MGVLVFGGIVIVVIDCYLCDCVCMVVCEDGKDVIIYYCLCECFCVYIVLECCLEIGCIY